MHPASPATVTTTSTTTTSVTTTTTTTAIPTVRAAEARTSLLDLPNEMLFQIAVHLLKDGYPIFFRALSNFALVSRRSAELMEEISLRVHRMHKPCTTNSIWLWTNLQSFVNEQVRGGRDARLAVSAGLDRLLKPGMHLVPRGRDAGHHLVCQARRTAALLEALASGKVISIDLHGGSRDDDVSKELIQAIRKADSL